MDGKIAVCTTGSSGFPLPNGYDTTAAKCFEAADAAVHPASEVDMVINIGWGGRTACMTRVAGGGSRSAPASAAEGHRDHRPADGREKTIVPVVSESGADYIKTSTGFAGGGATQRTGVRSRPTWRPM